MKYSLLLMNLKIKNLFLLVILDTARFRFKTDANLVYNEKINIPVCLISLSSVIKKDWIHCPTLNYKNACIKVFLKKYNFFYV